MSQLEQLRKILSVGDMRTTGAVAELSANLTHDARLLAYAICLMGDSEPGVAMRASDAVEKGTRARPELLSGHKEALLALLRDSRQQEVLWHVLQMVPRVTLMPAECRMAFDRAEECLQGSSRIVAAEALTAMFGLAELQSSLRRRAMQAAKGAALSSAPAVRARARGLLLRHR